LCLKTSLEILSKAFSQFGFSHINEILVFLYSAEHLGVQ
jgi:hypothetical protein